MLLVLRQLFPPSSQSDTRQSDPCAPARTCGRFPRLPRRRGPPRPPVLRAVAYRVFGRAYGTHRDRCGPSALKQGASKLVNVSPPSADFPDAAARTAEVHATRRAAPLIRRRIQDLAIGRTITRSFAPVSASTVNTRFQSRRRRSSCRRRGRRQDTRAGQWPRPSTISLLRRINHDAIDVPRIAQPHEP